MLDERYKYVCDIDSKTGRGKQNHQHARNHHWPAELSLVSCAPPEEIVAAHKEQTDKDAYESMQLATAVARLMDDRHIIP